MHNPIVVVDTDGEELILPFSEQGGSYYWYDVERQSVEAQIFPDLGLDQGVSQADEHVGVCRTALSHALGDAAIMDYETSVEDIGSDAPTPDSYVECDYLDAYTEVTHVDGSYTAALIGDFGGVVNPIVSVNPRQNGIAVICAAVDDIDYPFCLNPETGAPYIDDTRELNLYPSAAGAHVLGMTVGIVCSLPDGGAMSDADTHADDYSLEEVAHLMKDLCYIRKPDNLVAALPALEGTLSFDTPVVAVGEFLGVVNPLATMHQGSAGTFSSGPVTGTSANRVISWRHLLPDGVYNAAAPEGGTTEEALRPLGEALQPYVPDGRVYAGAWSTSSTIFPTNKVT